MKLECVFLNNRARPYALHEVVLVDELAARANQNLKDLKCAASNRDRHTSRAQLTPGEIDLPPLGCINGLWTLHGHVAGPLSVE